MKKITASLAVLMILATACSKKDIRSQLEEELTTEQVTQRHCASNDVLEAQIAADPKRGEALSELERKTEEFIRTGATRRAVGTLYVPVIVNVVLPNPASVTDAQIQSQINVLNKDFSKTNSELGSSNVYLAGYSLANVANCQIQFVVKGRVNKTTTATFGTNDAVKRTSAGGQDPTSPSTHLNLWVCDLSSGLLGYAQFPGGAAATDGVVVDYQAFGTSASYPMYASFNLGRTATHEVGHWFNLRHIWGDARCGNDGVSDTPAHDADNGGCPSTSHTSRCAGKPLEQWMNYMDYTDDRCMYMFSAGQKGRMDAAIDGPRSAYVSTTQ